MDRSIEIIKDVLNRHGVDSRYDQESGFLRFLASANDQDIRAVVVSGMGFLTIRLYYPMRFGKMRKRQGMEFAVRASWPMRFGGYYFDEDTGRLAFSVYTAVDGETVDPESLERLFHMLMAFGMVRIEASLPVVEKLTQGRIKAVQAVTAIETVRKKLEEEPRVPAELLDEHAIAVN